MNIFEQASRKNLQFTTSRGSVATYELWDIPLTSTKGFSLNDIAKAVKRSIDQEGEEDFVAPKSSGSTDNHLRLEILKHIIQVRQEENAKVVQQRENKEKKEKILAILEQKQNEELLNKSAEELTQLLNSL